jgi:hypothetical protein
MIQSITQRILKKQKASLVSLILSAFSPLTLPLCLVLVLGMGGVKAQIYVNTFTGGSACPTNGNTPTMATNSTGTAVSRATITCNSTANVFNSTTLNNTSSISNTSYIQFSATANSGFILNLTSVSFLRQGSNSAPNQMEVRYSTDGFSTSTTWGSAPVTPTAGTTATWDFADFSTGTAGTVTFRIYPYGTTRCDLAVGAASNTGTFRIDNLTINGTVSAAPTISTSGTLSAVNTTYGTASTSPTSFTVTGSALNGTTAVTVTPPAGFQVATSSDFSTTIGTSASALSLGTATSIASTTVYVRLAAATVVGSYSGNIVVAGGGASSQNVATVSSAVSKKALTITAANQSVAYGTAVVTVTGNGSYTPAGFVNSETSSVIGGSASYNTTYTTTTAAGSNVATITPVTTSLTATNYSFTAAIGNISVTAVTPSAPSITGLTPGNSQLSVAFSAPSSNGGASITNYEYSTNGGGNWTTPSPAVTSSPFTISGLTNGTTYDVQIRAVNSAGSGTASQTAQGTPAVASSPTISGAATASAFTTTYGTASSPQSFPITGSALTNDVIATAPTGFEVSSDGTTYGSTATFTQSSGNASGTLYVKLAATATVSGTYDSQNIVLSSTGASSSVNITTAASGNTVAQKALAITTATVASKVYDRSTTCGTVTPGALSGFVGSETVVVSSAAGTYVDWNVGTGKTATITYTLGNGTNGGLAANYSLANTNATGDITAKALTVTSPAVTSKTYDGNTNASITGSLSGVESGDAVTLTGTGTFATANVGTGISVTSTSTLGGADAGNYSLTQPIGLTGNITGASQTITFASLTPATLSTADYSPGATASSGLTVTYTSSNPCVATIVSGNIHIVGTGTTTITASQIGGGNYAAASSVNQTLSVMNPTSTLTAGDVVVIAYNTGGVPDNFALLFNIDLAAGTVFYVNDNELASTSSTSFTDLGEMEASFTVKAGQTIAAGTVIVLPWGAAAVSATQYDWSSTSGAGLGNGGEEIYIYIASSINSSAPSTFISYTRIGSSTSAIPSSLALGTTAIAPNNNAALRYATSGATYSGTKATLLTAIGNTSSNWNTTGATSFAATDWSFSVSPSPLITSSGTLSAVSTTYGTASASPTSFSVSASSLTADLTLTAPSGFEISSGSSYATSLTISPDACGAIASTSIDVRLAASTAVGTYSGNIALSSTGATTVNVATVSSTVSTKTLTITSLSASDKLYDGLTTVTVSGTPAYSGLENSESFSVSGTVSWAFSNAIVENNKILTRTGNYAAPSANYTVTQPTLTASITTRSLTITANNVNKPFGDVLTGGSGSTAFVSSGLQNGETIGSVTIAYGNGAASTDAVGTYTGEVTPSAATAGTFTASNYSISYVAGNIIISNTPTLDAATLPSSLTTTYGTASTGVGFVANGSNLVGNITATAQSGYEVSSDNSSFGASVSVSSGTTVYVRFTATLAAGAHNNAIAAVLSSSSATDVNVTTSSSGNSVSAKALTISGISISNKIYDGNATATISGTAAYLGLVNGESFAVSGTPSATFSDKNVGNNKTITVIDYTSPSSNYSFSQPSGLLANITTATLTLTSAAVSSKVYDGTTVATITGTLSGIISPDVVTLVGTGTFASADVGTGISVTSIATLSGADAGNYSLTQPTGLTGDITLKSLTITATDVSKEMGVLLTGGAGSTAFTSSGLAGSETIGSVTITYGAAGGTTGQGATAGTYSGQVTPSAATGGTFNPDNYSITYSSGSITVSGFTAGNIVVERVGNGSTTLTSAASAINVVELNTSGTTQQTISTLFTGLNLLTETGSGTSNGYLNSYNTSLGIPGYNSALTTASVAGLNTKATNILGTGATVLNRVVFPISGSPLPFTGNNFRSIIPTGSTTFYASGAGSSSTGGIWYYNGTSYTQVSTTQTNTRNVEIFNGNLYFSTGSGTAGIYQVGTGLPTSSGQTATIVVAAASPYGFSISPDGKTMYVADDGTVNGNTGGGIQKWTKSGSTWTRQYTFAVQSRGITVDYSGNNPVIYATTVVISPIIDNNKIIKIEDTGSSASSSDVLSAGSNYIFRGVDFAPAAAPSAPTIGTITQTTCASTTGSVELTGLPSGQWRIYGFPSGSAVGTGSSTTISGLAAGTYTFIVTSYTGRTSVASASATINTQPGAPGYPTAPTAASQSFCTSASPTVGDLTVTTGSSIKWYDASTNGNLVASETALTSGNYYASQTVSGCESATRTSVSVTINSSGTWIGDSNDDWNIAGNWCGGVPNSSSAVVSVPTGVVLNLDTSPSVLNLTIGSGATINAGTYTINIADGGSITNNGTFNSQTGELIFTGAGTISGTSAMSINNLTLNGALTVNTSPTADGIVQLNNGASVLNGSILYNSNAYLYYNQSGAASSSSFEWPTNNGPNKVAIYNGTNLSLNENKSLNTNLSLVNGRLTFGDYHLTLGESATITGTFSSTNMIIATGLGELRKRFAQGSGDLASFTFPVGNSSGVAEYTPIVLDFASGNYGANAYVGVRVQDSKQGTLNSSITNYLDRNWIVEPNDITGYSYKIQLHYVDADFVTDGSMAESDLKPIKISSGQWYQPTDGSFTNAVSQGSAGVFSIANYLEWNGLTTFSEFGGAGGSNQPLPVELLSFTAECANESIVLKWQTASEFNSAYFEIQKSLDGITWNTIGNQTAAGNSNELLSYSFEDASKSNNTSYYRLNQVDIDGLQKYYGPISPLCESLNHLNGKTIPNPSNDEFWIQITSDDESPAYYEIKDVKGNTVFQHQIAIQKGLNLYQVNSSLPSGMYFIHIVSENEKSLILKHLQN